MIFEKTLRSGGRVSLGVIVFEDIERRGVLTTADCAEPAAVGDLSICVHDVGDQLGTTRFVGIRSAVTQGGIAVSGGPGDELPDPRSPEAIEAQREALAMFSSLRPVSN